MKQQVRKGVFETNSSSTHTLTLYNKNDWEALKSNQCVWLDVYNGLKVVTKEEIENRPSYKNFLITNYPNFKNLDDANKKKLFDEFLKDEFLINFNELKDLYEVLEENVPDSEYIAVSLFGED